MALKYSITHNGYIWDSDINVNTINLQNGSVTDSITDEGIRVLHTAGMYCRNNIIIGNKTLQCANTKIKGNIIIAAMQTFPAPSSHTPGDVITWDDKEWLVCHYNSTNKQVYLIAKDIISTTKFGSNAYYAGSTLAQVAMNYQNNQMSAAALEQCVDVTVNGVTAKVFVPSVNQLLLNGFSWFNSNDNRKAKYQGVTTKYWTSSPFSSTTVVWVVNTTGMELDQDVDNTCGFRPCICVQL